MQHTNNDHVLAPPSGMSFDEWRDAVSRTFVPLEAAPSALAAANFGGDLSNARYGTLQLCEVMGGAAVTVRRSTSSIKRFDPGVIKVCMQVRGTSVMAQSGREAALSPGDMVIYDTSKRYVHRLAHAFDMFVSVIPRSAIRVSGAELRDGIGRTLRSDSGVGALLGPMLTSLRRSEGTGAPVGTEELVGDALTDLVSAALRQPQPDAVLRAGEEIVRSAHAYIDAHLGEPTLSSSTIAAAHHVSVRYLQRLFADDGYTVSDHIRRRRLELCRRDLADVRQVHRSVGSICAAHGIVEAAYFSRLFKSEYGISPSRYREGVLAEGSGSRAPRLPDPQR